MYSGYWVVVCTLVAVDCGASVCMKHRLMFGVLRIRQNGFQKCIVQTFSSLGSIHCFHSATAESKIRHEQLRLIPRCGRFPLTPDTLAFPILPRRLFFQLGCAIGHCVALDPTIIL